MKLTREKKSGADYLAQGSVQLATPRVQAKLLPGPAGVRLLHETDGPEFAALADALFQKRLSVRQSQGYVDEDAAVLGLMDACIWLARAQNDLEPPATHESGRKASINPIDSEPTVAELLRFDFFPRLVDQQPNEPSAAENFSQKPFAPLRDSTPGVYPIVDQLSQLQAMLDAGARIVQLRIKSDQGLTAEIDRAIGQAVALSERYPQTQLFINDYWQAALHHGAEGLHLGQEDLLTADLKELQKNGIRLGVSSHAFWEVARAATLQPSYVACGPIFPTRAKAMPWIAQGVENLRYWSHLLPFPVVGIGGLNADNLSAIAQTGCASASVIQAIVASSNPGQAYRSLQAIWNEHATARSNRRSDAVAAAPGVAARADAETRTGAISLARPTLQRSDRPATSPLGR